jgi:hypothetical protein
MDFNCEPVRRLSFLAVALLTLISLGCETAPSESNPKPEPEQDLTITFGGFLQNGPHDELLDGQCRPTATRDVLECDMHNGLMKWNITETTFQVTRTRDRDDERHYYRQRISIAPLQTETVSFKLGMQLPPDTQLFGKPLSHWGWLIVGAKGQPAK